MKAIKTISLPTPGHENSTRFSADGQPFEFDANSWSFSHPTSAARFDFSELSTLVEEDLHDEIRHVTARLLTTRNLITVRTAWNQLRSVLRCVLQVSQEKASLLEAEDIALWLSKGNARYCSIFRIFTDEWSKIPSPRLITDDALNLIQQVKFSKNQEEAIALWDPIHGPYRPAEDALIKSAIDDAFNNGSLHLSTYAFIRTLRGVGFRPSQAASMKVSDIRFQEGRSYIRIPLAKQRGVPFRGKFMPWKPISQGLADLLALHITTNIVPHFTAKDDLPNSPLFLRPRIAYKTSDDLSTHANGNSLRKAYVEALNSLNIISPITNQPLVCTPRRERHTVLTHLAMNGCTAEEIAANAGHSEPTSCERYVNATIDHFQRMESHVGSAFIPIADRFLGTVVSSERDNNAARDPDAVLMTEDLEAVGSCSDGDCQAIAANAAPVACYTCRKFRAWADAPHTALLEALEERRRSLLDAGHDEVAETLTPTIAALHDLLEALHERGAE